MNRPKEWKEVQFGNIGEFIGGGTPSTERSDFWGGDIHWTTSKRLGASLYLDNGEKLITKMGLNNSSTHLIPKGNLLVGTRVGVGKVAVNLIDMAISQDLTGIIINKEKCLSEFVAYQILSPRIQEAFRNSKRGVTIQGVSRDDIKTFRLFLPRLPEQRKIAAILFRIQKAVELQEKIIERTRELKKSAMQFVFTHGLRGEKTKDTEIGRMPESWEIRTIESIFQMKQGKSLSSRKHTGEYLKPFLRTANVFWGKIDLLILDEMDILSSERETLRLKYGDLLVCEGGDIGRTAVWKEEISECYYQNHLHRLRTKGNNANPFFFMYWMETAINLRGTYGTFGNRTTIPNLSGARLANFLVPVPSLAEQNEIQENLTAIDQKIALHTAKKSALQDLFKTTLNKLMSGEIRGKDLEIGG
jgi:type I restriction enzyme S subunit